MKDPELVPDFDSLVLEFGSQPSAVEGLQLIRAYLAIEDVGIRRSILELTERIAEQGRREN